ncbi:hypothetical protein PG996_011804 [Apiospora saccharicola]|uniref:Heterokaryon incompatibility domain-containing protein n=1 Tax=Apiospora saccharicola TaxID=335842 RepID=A0ABR1UG44_9PEZI
MEAGAEGAEGANGAEGAEGAERAPQLGSSTPHWASDCTTCQDIWKLFSDPKSAHAVNLGSFQEALSTSCPNHKPLVQAFYDYVTDSEEEADTETLDVGLTRDAEDRSVRFDQSVADLGLFWHLLSVKDAAVESHPGTGRILDPDWANLGMVKQWKRDCLTLHGHLCDNPMKIWNTRPAWLIDVRQRCLVPGQVPENYVALSYVYGSHRGSHIDAGMLARLQQPLALDSPGIAQLLPPIVQHAMYLTYVIGEIYLWVDALCIPHHDPEATKEQLGMMGAIYANAVVAIVAADGDASDGLQGLQGASASRNNTRQRIIPFGDEQIVVRNSGTFFMSRDLPYYDRGWTYQENSMCARQIFLNGRELHWGCSCGFWDEELVPGAEVDMHIDHHRIKTILAGFPDLSSLGHIIEGYNKRTLRYGEDALPGITGLLSVLSRSFAGGFLYGLPVLFFDRALGWRPDWGKLTLTVVLHQTGLQRIVYRHQVCPPGPGSAGKILADRRNHPYHRMVYGPITQTPPSERRRIRSTWFENRQGYKDFTKPLPSGWTRHDAPTRNSTHNDPFLYPDGCDQYIFKHDAMPAEPHPDGDEDRAWHYPFPVAEIQESALPCMPEQTAYLKDEEVGSLHLHNKDSWTRFPTLATRNGVGLPVDLVAIYKSRKISGTWDTQEMRYGLPLKRRDVYCVLWIEWIEGVAYRLASGHVEAEAWDGLEHESVSLVLG